MKSKQLTNDEVLIAMNMIVQTVTPYRAPHAIVDLHCHIFSTHNGRQFFRAGILARAQHTKTAWAPEETYLPKPWGTSTPKEVRHLVLEVFGEDNVVYGSDWAFGDPGRQLAFWQQLFTDRPGVFKKLTQTNAMKMLGLEML